MIELLVDGRGAVVLNDDGTIDIKGSEFLDNIDANDNLPDFVNVED